MRKVKFNAYAYINEDTLKEYYLNQLKVRLKYLRMYNKMLFRKKYYQNVNEIPLEAQNIFAELDILFGKNTKATRAHLKWKAYYLQCVKRVWAEYYRNMAHIICPETDWRVGYSDASLNIFHYTLKSIECVFDRFSGKVIKQNGIKDRPINLMKKYLTEKKYLDFVIISLSNKHIFNDLSRFLDRGKDTILNSSLPHDVSKAAFKAKHEKENTTFMDNNHTVFVTKLVKR